MPRVGGGNLLAQIRSIYVTIDAADASIREVLESIEAQSDLRFIYADEVKPILTKVVTVREKNVSANRILDQILPDVGLQYSVGGTQVRIYQAASGSRDVAQTVSGTVISGTDNSPLAGVMNIPTVIFFKDGKEIAREVGALPPESFTRILDENL